MGLYALYQIWEVNDACILDSMLQAVHDRLQADPTITDRQLALTPCRLGICHSSELLVLDTWIYTHAKTARITWPRKLPFSRHLLYMIFGSWFCASSSISPTQACKLKLHSSQHPSIPSEKVDTSSTACSFSSTCIQLDEMLCNLAEIYPLWLY